MPVRQLPEAVINRIAAGEVVERPASVVKELVENALDAGARRIDILTDGGGRRLVQVRDDGEGMTSADLGLAVERHATSKLADDDLVSIGTLGFRGEALASIGGVAHVTLQSRQPDQTCGAQITCNGGDLGTVQPWNGSAGTRLEVRHLFYNTPVRRKFLRTTSTEMGHISEQFTRLALAHARQGGLHLTLRHNNKQVYDVKSTATLLDRIALFFGPEIANQVYAIQASKGPATLTGYVADPACERGTAKMQYLFLNGRWIRDRSLGHALQEAYRGLLMTGRYAVAFLFLDLPPDQVDVNVHPTKAEVRFRDSQALYHLVFSAVRERLRAENLTARLQAPSTIRPSGEIVPQETPPWSLQSDPPPAPALPFPAAPHLPPSPGPASSTQLPQDSALPATLPSSKVIQLYDAYLVMETDAGMLVIDQHALHERILFEHLKTRLRSGPLETQPLLIPEPVDLSADAAARTLEQRAALAELGLGVEDFGGGTVLLTSYPAMLSRRSPQAILRVVVDHLTARDRVPSREVLFNDLLSLMACHAAVRAGDRLTPEEIADLVQQRHLADDTHHCPHGRPTALLFSKHDLDKQFRRV